MNATPNAATAGTFRIANSLLINRLGYGTMRLVGEGAWGEPPDREDARNLLRRCLELGIKLLDTADAYGPTIAEELIAEALHPYPADLVIATKVGGTRDEQGGWIRASRPEQLREQVEHDLKLLQVERLGLVNMRFGVGTTEPDPVPLAEQLGILAELREEGKLDLIGVSTVTAEMVDAALQVTPIATVQNAYGIANRTDDPIVDLCREHHIAFVPYYPLGSAFTGGPQALAADPAIASVATKHDITGSQVALTWLLAHYNRMLLIPGTSSVTHLEENLAVDAITLDDDDLTTLDHVTHLGGPGF